MKKLFIIPLSILSPAMWAASEANPDPPDFTAELKKTASVRDPNNKENRPSNTALRPLHPMDTSGINIQTLSSIIDIDNDKWLDDRIKKQEKNIKKLEAGLADKNSSNDGSSQPISPQKIENHTNKPSSHKSKGRRAGWFIVGLLLLSSAVIGLLLLTRKKRNSTRKEHT